MRTNSGAGGCPSRGETVSFTDLQPETNMNAATAMPHKPSALKPQKRFMSMDKSTARVAMQSERESEAAARIAAESIFLPMRLL